MSAKIRVLSDHTINQIAAGEVIENPASVVKELVENSIDAGATEISIEIESGGRQLIRITDNGCGMILDDALLCLERHATSKLQHVDDIHTLTTMGFRGEAIPSIASISKFTLLTCPKENAESAKEIGTLIIVDGGKLISCSKAARNPGTTIEVKSLFFNVPARKKFLKSPSIDANEIHKKVSTIALGYPNIKFHLSHDGKTLISTNRNPDLNLEEQQKLRARDILGDEFINNCQYIEESFNGITIEGVISTPSNTRHNRTGQYIYINKRAVHSPLVSYAVKDGFGTTIDQNRFPVFVLNLHIDGSLVDVNVHPQKTEVRLRQEQMIRELIVKAVRRTLSHQSNLSNEALLFSDANANFTKSYSLPPNFKSQDRKFYSDVLPWEFEAKEFEPKEFESKEFESNLSGSNDSESNALEFKDFESKVTFNTSKPSFFSQNDIVHQPGIQSSWPFKPENAFESSLKGPLNYTSKHLFEKNIQTKPSILATIKGYILLDGNTPNSFFHKFQGGEKKEGGIIVVNQKNAHARIIFEKLSKQKNESLSKQSLLIPLTIEMSYHERERIKQLIPFLNKLGIDIEEFGTTTFIINAMREDLNQTEVKTLIEEILHDHQFILKSDEVINGSLYKKIAGAACRASISSEIKLSFQEAEILLEQLFLCENPMLCPAGKPTLAQIHEEMLAKLFTR